MHLGTEHYIQENTDGQMEKANKEQLIRSVANSRAFSDTFTNLYNKMEQLLQRQNITCHHLNDAQQLFRALQHYKKQKPEDIAELAQLSNTNRNITEAISITEAFYKYGREERGTRDNSTIKKAKFILNQNTFKALVKNLAPRAIKPTIEDIWLDSFLKKGNVYTFAEDFMGFWVAASTSLEALKNNERNYGDDEEFDESTKCSKSQLNTSMAILPNPVLTTGTAIYLEGFGKPTNKVITEAKADLPKVSKPKEKFEPIQKNRFGKELKQPFIPRSGPESDGNGFKEKNKIESPENLSQGTEKYLPTVDEIPGPGPKTDHEDDSADNVNGFTDFNVKKAVNTDKKPGTRLNNSKKQLVKESEKTKTMRINNLNTNTLMEKTNKLSNNKSEFDRLCEDVLGPEEVELGIEPNEGGENIETTAETGEGCEDCSPADKIRNILGELEAVLAELEGTPTDAPIDDGGASGGDVPLTDDGATPGAAVKEAVYVDPKDNNGDLKSQKEVGATSVKGRANVVNGDASQTISGEGDGTIENKDRTGKVEKQADGVAKMNGKPSKSNIEVNSKIKGKGQSLFHVK